MGASYDIIPVKTFFSRPHPPDALCRLGAVHADLVTQARLPSLNELGSAVRSIPGYDVSEVVLEQDWQISVSGKQNPSCDSAVFESRGYRGDPDDPADFYFYRGTP